MSTSTCEAAEARIEKLLLAGPAGLGQYDELTIRHEAGTPARWTE